MRNKYISLAVIAVCIAYIVSCIVEYFTNKDNLVFKTEAMRLEHDAMAMQLAAEHPQLMLDSAPMQSQPEPRTPIGFNN